MAMALAWTDASTTPPLDLRRERIMHTDSRAPSAPFSADPADWTALDMDLRDPPPTREAAVSFTVVQPFDGKLTVVIEDTNGTRVRNLISGQAYSRGSYSVGWDCTNEDGQFVDPAMYAWRAISHVGITPHWLTTYGNGGESSWGNFGPNHGTFQAAASNGQLGFFGADVTEGGNSLIAVGPDGRMRQAYAQPMGSGIRAIAVAADSTYLYRANDGPGWTTAFDGVAVNVSVTFSRYLVSTGARADFPGFINYCSPLPYVFGPASPYPALRNTSTPSLRGMALQRGLLFVSVLHLQALAVLNASTCAVVGSIPLPGRAGPVTASPTDSAVLYVGAGTSVYRLTLPTPSSFAAAAGGGATLLLLVPDTGSTMGGLAVGSEGQIFVSQPDAHVIRVYGAGGQAVGTVSRAVGGPYEGPYDPSRFVTPQGIALFNGTTLLVTEARRNPKRASMWDVSDALTAAATAAAQASPAAGAAAPQREFGRLLVEKIGDAAYGGPGAGFDPADPSRWIGLGALWSIDMAAGTATPTAVLQASGGHLGGLVPFCRNYRMVRRDGRTFLLGQEKINLVSELLPDGSLRDLAFLSTAHQTLYALSWQRTPFSNAFERLHPDTSIALKYANKDAYRYSAVLWVDANGDGRMQDSEFQLGNGAVWRFGDAWGNRQHDLTFRVVVGRYHNVTGALLDRRLVTLEPAGYNAAGAPNYPLPAEAMDAARVISRLPRTMAVDPSRVPVGVDRFGGLIALSAPMVGMDAAGTTRWTYPNRWSDVHGSHNAPMPAVGVLQGSLFFMGVEPLDAESDVGIIVGNHGRFFLVTSDGLYLDEMFHDVRMGTPADDMLIGGEAFGGFFGKADAAAGGQYLLQAASYRIYRIDGLDTVTRSNGSFAVTPAKLVLAQDEVNARLQTEAAASGTAVATTVTVPFIAGVSVAAKDRDFPTPFAASWNSAAAKAKLAYDELHLYVHWYVADASPWVNGGLDWQMMFNTGDCVDIQLGLLPAPAALPTRSSPVVGDVRLLIAPLQGTNIAVLYRNRAAANSGAPLQPVTFVSPWRAETVDDVRRLSNVTIVVAKSTASYTVTASIPLSEIFWPWALPASGGIPGVRKLDIGALYGDFGGTMIAQRSYWANEATGLVNDVPGEVMLSPNMWGDLRFSSPPGGNLSIAFAGVLANSGESGQAVVHVGPQLGTYNSLGVVVDKFGFLWDRAGSGRLNRLSQDGRLSASYPIVAGSRLTDRLSIVDGELLVLNVMGYFYALNVTAPAGTAPKLLFPTVWYASYLSPGSYGGRVAVLTQRARLDNFTLAWLNPRNTSMEPLLQLPSVIQGAVYVEVLPHNGSILVLERPTVDADSWVVAPNGTILRTFRGIGAQQWCDGYLWSFNYHASVYRFNAQTYTADPGVVLGGNSGSFIGHMQEDTEINLPTGIAALGNGLYAISSWDGIMHIVRWDALQSTLVIVRRLGGIYATPDLAVDRAGRINMRGGTWFFNDAPDQYLRDSSPNNLITTQSVTLPDDTVLNMCFPYATAVTGYSTSAGFMRGALDSALPLGCTAGTFTSLGLAQARRYYGAAYYTATGGSDVLLVLDDLNAGHAVNPRNVNIPAVAVALQANASLRPPTPYRSLAMQDANTLLAAGNGTVVRFGRNGTNWAELDRFDGSSVRLSEDTRFGAGPLDIACDSGRLWVSDTLRHRVLLFDAISHAFLAGFGQRDTQGSDITQLNRPTTIAARGDRAVLYDSNNHRVVKLMVGNV